MTGTSGIATRTVGIDFNTASKSSGVFSLGVASRGKIIVRGNFKIDGVNSPAEAGMFSSSSEVVAIEARGNPNIGGDLFVTSGSTGSIYIQGNAEVGGESDIYEIYEHHVHLNTEKPEFPEIDATPFASMTTAIIDGSTNLNGNLVFNNLCIKAGTNPDFHGNLVLNGIVYVEVPNKVSFHGNTDVNGFIVTQDASALNIEDNQIEFRGNIHLIGVEVLPDTPKFAEVKEQAGTALLAPGFGITFRGTNKGINGTIAADQLTFRGNSIVGGQMTGTILGLKDLEMDLRGNTKILVNHEVGDMAPAGFKHSLDLTTIPKFIRRGPTGLMCRSRQVSHNANEARFLFPCPDAHSQAVTNRRPSALLVFSQRLQVGKGDFHLKHAGLNDGQILVLMEADERSAFVKRYDKDLLARLGGKDRFAVGACPVVFGASADHGPVFEVLFWAAGRFAFLLARPGAAVLGTAHVQGARSERSGLGKQFLQIDLHRTLVRTYHGVQARKVDFFQPARP
ncbi:MAG: hypothetical protein QF792_08340, partial [Phycisphaerae bacterium]|nr:hypothetical protein [Phycisphaerae bacterium]